MNKLLNPMPVEGDRLIDEDGIPCIYLGLRAGYYVFQYVIGQRRISCDIMRI